MTHSDADLTAYAELLAFMLFDGGPARASHPHWGGNYEPDIIYDLNFATHLHTNQPHLARTFTRLAHAEPNPTQAAWAALTRANPHTPPTNPNELERMRAYLSALLEFAREAATARAAKRPTPPIPEALWAHHPRDRHDPSIPRLIEDVLSGAFAAHRNERPGGAP